MYFRGRMSLYSSNAIVKTVYRIKAILGRRLKDMCFLLYLMNIMEKNSLGQQPSSREGYGSLYKGIGRGDTWTLPENFAENPRAAIVAHTREKFPGPVSVLDIGCGKGINTKWIAEVDRNSHWTGVDVVSQEELGLKIQKEDGDRFHFVQGNMLDESFRGQLAGSVGKFEMIVDQGGCSRRDRGREFTC